MTSRFTRWSVSDKYRITSRQTWVTVVIAKKPGNSGLYIHIRIQVGINGKGQLVVFYKSRMHPGYLIQLYLSLICDAPERIFAYEYVAPHLVHSAQCIPSSSLCKL